jgi:hypothetical protein
MTYKEFKIENEDWLSPELRNVTDKLTTLRNAIRDQDTRYWEMVNNWLNDILFNEEYPPKEQLILANELWRKYG